MIDTLKEKLDFAIQYGIDFEKRTIYVWGELTEELGTLLRLKYSLIKNWWKDIKQEDFKDITLDISSPGGSIYAVTAALDFYDEILKEDNVLVNTKAQTLCMSAATVLLAGGTGERTATKRCKFMLHDIQVDGIGGTAKQVQSAMSNLNEEQIELFSFYAQYAQKGKDNLEGKELIKEAKKWIKKYCKESIDHFETAEEMKNLNLIDRIL